jgi:hypothetical protein
MPRTTKAQTQSDAAKGLLSASILLEDDPELDSFSDQDEFEAYALADDISDFLDLSALNWMEIAQAIAGDRLRGTYDQIQKSLDFFCLLTSTSRYIYTLCADAEFDSITLYMYLLNKNLN